MAGSAGAFVAAAFISTRPDGRFFEGFRTPAEHSTNKRHAPLAGVRKPPEKETAGEGTKGRAVFDVSAGTEGRFFIQPEGYGMKIAK